jgi:photosystem II stability/assembly factor-like uncharacterized protein
MAKKEPLLKRLAFLAVAAMLLPLCPSIALAQNPPTLNPNCRGILSRASLVSLNAGWAVVDQRADYLAPGEGCPIGRLYWTDSNGQNWRDITPVQMPTRNIGQIFFVDRAHGWMLSADTVDADGDTRSYLLSTSDGGMTWRTLEFQKPIYKLLDDMFPGEIFFSDLKHGWILWSLAERDSTVHALLATADGGKTWKRLPDPPGNGPTDFVSARDGWMIGDPKGGPVFPDQISNHLWATRDGGAHWQDVATTLPSDVTKGQFIALKFRNTAEGMLAADVGGGSPDADTYHLLGCVTHDGGKTWQFSKLDESDGGPAFGRTHIIWILFDFETQQSTIRADNQIISPSFAPGIPLGGQLESADFFDDANGWVTYLDQPAARFAGTELLATTDGGKTFQIITPPAAETYLFPSPEFGAVNGATNRSSGKLVGGGAFAGGPMEIFGNGFLSENAVWFGSRVVPVTTKNGGEMFFQLPPDIVPGTYEVFIENAHGKSNTLEVSVRPAQSLSMSAIDDKDYQPLSDSTIHRGQTISIYGRGLQIENTVWFGNESVTAQSHTGSGFLQVEVPGSIPPGRCEIYVSNASGKSNIITLVVE